VTSCWDFLGDRSAIEKFGNMKPPKYDLAAKQVPAEALERSIATEALEEA
jgi:hypothetical protein